MVIVLLFIVLGLALNQFGLWMELRKTKEGMLSMIDQMESILGILREMIGEREKNEFNKEIISNRNCISGVHFRKLGYIEHLNHPYTSRCGEQQRCSGEVLE